MTIVPYRDPALPVEDRVQDLLRRMTLEQKAGQLSQYFYIALDIPDDFDIETLPPEQRSIIEQTRPVEVAVSAGVAGSVLFVQDPAVANRLQRQAVEDTEHGIPLLFGYDVVHGLRTVFPVPVGLAATWCPDTIERAQEVAAREARAAGIHWTFAPMIDVARDPRWGRIVEGVGEDPYLGSVVAAAQVRGFQGDLGADRVIAGPKHLTGYGAARGGRDYEDAEISDTELWNVYLPPFRAAVEAGAENIMTAYMDLNGVPASGNRWLLTDVLRDELGFDGFVVSDANAVRSLETQHFAQDLTDAAARAVNAGLDMEMAMVDPAFSRLPAAVKEGLVTEETIDAAVRRVLTVKFRMGLFENPYADELRAETVLTAPRHRDVARIAAERSIVLLKNAEGALPLNADALTSVAVIGELAGSERDTLGPWVFVRDTSETSTVLDGLRARLGDSVRVEHAPGAGIPARLFPSPFDVEAQFAGSTQVDRNDDAEIARAVELAAASDVAVVVVGQQHTQIGESASTSTLDLPGRQLEQLQQISATGTPVVLVVMSGRPLDLRWADANVPAIVEVWYPGTSGGTAVASVLLGDIAPAGRLPFTWPRHVGQVPMTYAHYRTFAPQDQSKRYWEEESTPLYPFGHGLSYATFAYGNLQLAHDTIAIGETTTVSVDVTNTSDRDGDDVVQLYVHQRYGTASRPVRELRGFERIGVPAGETRTVTFELGAEQLRYWSTIVRTFVQDATTVDLWVGASSTAELTTTLEVKA